MTAVSGAIENVSKINILLTAPIGTQRNCILATPEFRAARARVRGLNGHD